MKPVLVFRQVAHEGLGSIAPVLERKGLRFEVIDALATKSLQAELQNYSGLMVMGGPMNVDEIDRYPALADEVKHIQTAIEQKLPVLGICLGSQLLAKALGSKVYANRIKEIGWYEIEMLPAAADDPLFRFAGPRTTVFQWHGDTFDLPAGAVQLARSPLCENQAFRFGASAYGLQFHMEVTAEIVENWLCESSNCGELAGLDYIDPETIRRETPTKLPIMQTLGDQVFGAFVEMCLEQDKMWGNLGCRRRPRV